MARSNDKRVVIVTGSSRGLGRAIAVRFGREGWRVVVNYREQETGLLVASADAIQSRAEAIRVQGRCMSTRGY